MPKYAAISVCCDYSNAVYIELIEHITRYYGITIE
jgi:hypothetical protein